MPFNPSDSVQVLNPRNNKPSKYKLLEPTSLEDLLKHSPGQYRPVVERDLHHLGEGDMIRVSFINNEDMWIFIEVINDEQNLIYGKICSVVKNLTELQKGQRVCITKNRICEIRFADTDEEEDDY